MEDTPMVDDSTRRQFPRAAENWIFAKEIFEQERGALLEELPTHQKTLADEDILRDDERFAGAMAMMSPTAASQARQARRDMLSRNELAWRLQGDVAGRRRLAEIAPQEAAEAREQATLHFKERVLVDRERQMEAARENDDRLVVASRAVDDMLRHGNGVAFELIGADNDAAARISKLEETRPDAELATGRDVQPELAGEPEAPTTPHEQSPKMSESIKAASGREALSAPARRYVDAVDSVEDSRARLARNLPRQLHDTLGDNELIEPGRFEYHNARMPDASSADRKSVV